MNDLFAQLQSTLGESYTLDRELGGGGMSRVFVATERALGRQVVIKVLPIDAAGHMSLERFKREISLAARLQQANIVPVLTAGEAAGVPYFTMPYVEGQSLRVRLAAGDVPIAQAIGILKEVARALAYAHAQQVVHRDIKPDNILLSGGSAMVTDFGVAKALSAAVIDGGDETLTRSGLAIGTPAYMAPEQAAGDPNTNHRADIYAFGCVGYELLTGSAPFAGRSVQQVVVAHLTEEPQPVEQRRAGIPPRLAALINRCLAKDPSARPQSADELIAELDAAITGSVSMDAPTVLVSSGAQSRASRTPLLLTAVAAVVVVTAVLLWPKFRPKATSIDSVAVLPFENVGGDTANAYFADGIAEELTTALAKIGRVRVSPRSAAFRFRGSQANAKTAGAALGVSSVLEGTVRRSGGRVRVTASLTNVANDSVVWSDNFEREVKDVFAVEDDLTKAILGALRVPFAGRPSAAAASGDRVARSHGTTNLDAYDDYLRGLALLNRRGPGVRASVPFFEQAIAKDSSFARAHAGLATALAIAPLFNFGPPDPLAGREKALTQSRQAVRMDSTSATARVALGFALAALDRTDEARSEFLRAMALDSTDDVPPRALSSMSLANGKYDDAIRYGKRATEIGSLQSASFAVYSRALEATGDMPGAVNAAHRISQIDPQSPGANAFLAIAELLSGNKARAHDLAVATARAPVADGFVSYVLAATGDHERASALEKKLLTEWETNAYVGEALAALYLGTRDTTRALAILERAVTRHEPTAVSITFGHPIFDPLRGSARFTAILKAHGLDAVALSTRPGR